MELVDQLDLAIHRLLRALAVDERRLMAVLGGEPFSPLDLEIVFFLGANPGATASEVGTFLHVRPTTVQSAVDRLERRGLVARNRSQLKGRAVALALSAQGGAFHARMATHNLANCRTMLAALPASEQSAFVANLTAIAATFAQDLGT